MPRCRQTEHRPEPRASRNSPDRHRDRCRMRKCISSRLTEGDRRVLHLGGRRISGIYGNHDCIEIDCSTLVCSFKHEPVGVALRRSEAYFRTTVGAGAIHELAG